MSDDRPTDTTRKEQCWVALTQSEARAKISHAFRNKRHDPDIFLFLKHIQERMVVPNRCQGLSRDAVFEAVNTKILATSLEGSEADHYIKYLLMRVVESELWLILTNHCFCKCSMISDRGQEMGSRCGVPTFRFNVMAIRRTDNFTKKKVDSLETSQRLSLMCPFPSIPYPSRRIDLDSVETSKTVEHMNSTTFGNNVMAIRRTDNFTKKKVHSLETSQRLSLMSPSPSIPYPSRRIDLDSEETSKKAEHMNSRYDTPTFQFDAMNVNSLESSQLRILKTSFPTIPYPSLMIDSDIEKTSKPDQI
jgi:hypothetical protein